MASKQIHCPIPKTELEFLFRTHNFKDVLKRTTINMNDNLWKNVVHFDMDLSMLQGYDASMDCKLDELKNRNLVYSSMLHYLGRCLFFSRQVYERYTRYTSELKSEMNAKATSSTDFEETLAIDKKVNSAFYKWRNETITWADYVKEISLREMFASKLREKCSKHAMADSSDFMIDFLANLHLENCCWRTLKRGQA